MKDSERCEWCLGSELYRQYHDLEWGVPLHDDQKLFEFLILEGAQAGLSWSTILNKRASYREAYDDFDPEKVVRYTPARIATMLQNAGIVRNRLKLESSVSNAHAFLNIQDEFGSFDQFVWDFVDGAPIQNNWASLNEVPATTDISDELSKTLKKRGFRFVGSTICYAFMQATGMVNDHVTSCYRHRELS